MLIRLLQGGFACTLLTALGSTFKAGGRGLGKKKPQSRRAVALFYGGLDVGQFAKTALSP